MEVVRATRRLGLFGEIYREDEVDDAHAPQILLKGLGARNDAPKLHVSAIALRDGMPLRLARARGYANAQVEAKRAQLGTWAAASFSRVAIELTGDQAESPIAVVICKTTLRSDEG